MKLLGALLLLGAAPDDGSRIPIASPSGVSCVSVIAQVPVVCELHSDRAGDAIVLEVLVGGATAWEEAPSVELDRTRRSANLFLDLGRVGGLKGGDLVAVRARAAGDRAGRSAGEPILLRMLSVEDAETTFQAEAEQLASQASEVFEATADRVARLGWAERTYGELDALNKTQSAELREFLEAQRSLISSLGEVRAATARFAVRAACARVLLPEPARRCALATRRTGDLLAPGGAAGGAVARIQEALRAEGRGARRALLGRAREANERISVVARDLKEVLEASSIRLSLCAEARRVLRLQDMRNEELKRLKELRR